MPNETDKPPAEEPLDAVIRETLLAILIAFVLAFVFRAYLVEPFVIPTGSMNPTLKGLHAQMRCTDCGYRYHMDLLEDQLREVVETDDGRRFQVTGNRITDPNLTATCPMCGFRQPLIGRLKAPGDRILVDKFEYTWQRPSRWDVVVFKNPQAYNNDGSPGPATNYIKRLIGLPGESLYLLDGDVYRSNDGGNNFQIARKTDRDENLRWEKVQRALWQPVYHSVYDPRLQDERNWTDPWVAVTEGWVRDRLGYHFKPPPPNEAGTQATTGMLRFDFAGPPRRSLRTYPYNQLTSEARHTTPIEDIRLAATLVPAASDTGAAPTVLGMSTTSRLNDPQGRQHRLHLALDQSGQLQVSRWPLATSAGDVDRADTPNAETLLSVSTQPLRAGRPTRVELWLVDQSILVWRDGKLVGRENLPLPASLRSLAERPRAESIPTVELVLTGTGSLTDVQLDRDTYYEASHVNTGEPGLGGIQVNASTWRPAQSRPIKLGDGHYFCVGDNPARSHDGRFWSTVEPFIRDRHFADVDEPDGLIPESLLIGRAVFVYLPAPFPLHERSRDTRAIPNLGDMRFIH